jgi:hypothetical protein
MIRLGWLVPFDVEVPYTRRQVEAIHPVASGGRNDYLWVRLDPPIAPGEAANEEELEHVLLIPRHAGHPLTIPIVDPVHVYVCTVRGATTNVPSRISSDDVEIRHWGVVSAA